MKRQDSLKVLEMCMDQLNSMTTEQFVHSLYAKGLIDKKYDNSSYHDDTFYVETQKNTQEDSEENYHIDNNYLKQISLFYGNMEMISGVISGVQADSKYGLSLAA